MELSPLKQSLLETRGHLLVLGGPGSGKTTIALLKAERVIQSAELKAKQKILFLSFARATVARIAEQARKIISDLEEKNLEVNTYHGFTWNLLQSHGYLLNKKRIRLLPPPQAASVLSGLTGENRKIEIERLFEQDGVLHFDLFASTAIKLLSKSTALTKILSDKYPLIILDEFQDTNADEWGIIKLLGERSKLLTLADADQRIYEFRGADPKRIADFITVFSPTKFDFGVENNRSNGTDIATYGHDLLSGANKTKNYKNVSVFNYAVRKGIALHAELKGSVLKACKRLHDSGRKNWSIAVLVPSKRLMIEVSDYLSAEQTFSKGRKFPPCSHDVAMDVEGPALAAILIANLLENWSSVEKLIISLMHHLRAYVRGRKPKLTQSDQKILEGLEDYFANGRPKRKGLKLIDGCERIANGRQASKLAGVPSTDWLAIRQLFAESSISLFQEVADDAKYVRLLHKGAMLTSRLNELWRKNGNYTGVTSAVHDALLQEHFAASMKTWKGVYVMTMHKSKGKEFEEVIIYEGCFHGRIVGSRATANEINQARLKLRVAVTRAKLQTTIMTPQNNPCEFV